MTAQTRSLVGTVAAILVAALVASILTWVLHARQDGDSARAAEFADYTPPPRDRVAAALKTFASERVHVAPEAEAAGWLSRREKARIEKESVRARVPVYIFVGEPTAQAGATQEATEAQLVAGLPDELGLLVLWSGPRGENRTIPLGTAADYPAATPVGSADVALPRVIEAAQGLKVVERDSADRWGGPWRAALFGLGLALVVLALLVGLATVIPGGRALLPQLGSRGSDRGVRGAAPGPTPGSPGGARANRSSATHRR